MRLVFLISIFSEFLARMALYFRTEGVAFFLSGPDFNWSWEVSDETKTWFLEVIWIKMCCFCPVEVSETHF